jgi:hypothetical protein
LKIDNHIIYYLIVAAVISSGCSDDSPQYPSALGKAPPYILKTGCTFAIVEELSRNSISSPKAKGLPDTWVSASISLGDSSITVSNCEIVENTKYLPIYQD